VSFPHFAVSTIVPHLSPSTSFMPFGPGKFPFGGILQCVGEGSDKMNLEVG
jgi:hypothetical protein